MVAVRIFFYITIPLILLAGLKGGNLFSSDFLEVIVYVIPLGVYGGFIGAFLRKEVSLISSRILITSGAFIIGIWGFMLIIYLFWNEQICLNDNGCELITIPKLLSSLLICLAPLLAVHVFRLYKKNKH